MHGVHKRAIDALDGLTGLTHTESTREEVVSMSAPAERPRPNVGSDRTRPSSGRGDLHAAPADIDVTVLRSDEDVRAYADELSHLLRRSEHRARRGIRVPTSEAIAERQADASSDADSTATHAIADSALVDTVGPSWSASRLRTELGGVSRQALNQRVKRGTLLGLPTGDGVTVYPVFQFYRRGGRVEVLPGVQAILKELVDQSAWSVAVLLNTAAPELEGATPVEWERRGGEADRLAELAGVLKRERSRA